MKKTKRNNILQQVPTVEDPNAVLRRKLANERSELASKIEKLKDFVTLHYEFKELNWEHIHLLQEQLEHMSHYETTLVRRLILLNQSKLK